MDSLFFQLIRIAIEKQDGLSYIPTEQEWEDCYEVVKKQALSGVCFVGVNRLAVEQRPPRPLYLKWMGKAARIQQRNEMLNEASSKICQTLKNENYQCCILKGQGISLLYNDKLSMLRQSGDIDIWVRPDGVSVKERRKKITSLARRITPDCHPVYHNVAVHLNNEIELEIHYTPSWMNSPMKNRRLQRWFEEQADSVMQHEVNLPNGKNIPAPTQVFNEVFILQHIYRHLFGEGIGLRQVMDYYFVLMNRNDDGKELINTLRQLGLLRFARALMWVMGEIFGMPSEKMICEPNEKEGRFILEEMMLAGNFGHYDERIDRSKTTPLQLFLMRTHRNLRFITYYPEEVICTPLFKIWHYACRKLHII